MGRYKSLTKKYHKLSIKSLIGVALQNLEPYREGLYISAICELQRRSNPQAVAILQKLSQSKNWRKKVVAINVMRELHIPKRPFSHYAVNETQEVLAKAIKDLNTDVVIASLYGISFRKTEKALQDIIVLSEHEDDDIRRAVVSALYQFNDDISIQTLIKLATANNDNVREYATFALAEMHENIDTPELRQQLFMNCEDKCHYVADDALAGLIYRKDSRIFDLLQRRLTRDDELQNCIEYAIRDTQNVALAKLLNIEI